MDRVQRLAVLLGLALVVLVFGGLLLRYDVGTKIQADILALPVFSTETPTPTPTPEPTPTPLPTPVPYSYQGLSIRSLGGSLRLPISLRAGTRLEGYFEVAQGKDIRFSIEDPFGRKIRDAGLVVGRYEFSIGASNTGVYTLVFQNCTLCVGRSIGLHSRVIGGRGK